MSRSEDRECAEFFGQQHLPLVNFLLGRGVSSSDAEDVAQMVFMQVFARWATLHNPRAYLYQAAKNEVAALVRRQRRDLDGTRRWAGSQGECSAAEDVYHLGEVSIVRDSFIALPPRQREVMARVYEDHQVGDIAKALGISPATVRSHRRHGRETLQFLFASDGHDIHWRAGQRLYEAWRRGDTLPAALRPLIGWAWDQAKALGVDPDHGTAMVPLGRDEVTHRRRESPLAACSWVRDTLTELGKSNRQMMVVVDAEGVVLWRDGDRKVLQQADKLGFVEGACWDIKNAGANGIALALMTGRTVQVCGWEHYVQDQHRLDCVAAPVRDPRDGRVLCVVNLTGTWPTVHHAIVREIDTIAMRLHRQLRGET